MDNLYNLLGRDRVNWQNCKEALTAQGQNMGGIATDDFAGKIRNLQLVDGFEQTPELRNFPDLREGLTDSSFKMIVLKGCGNSLGIAITLPAGNTGSIDWGDGTMLALTASGTAVNYYHTWSSWSLSVGDDEEYNIVTITGRFTAIAAIPGTITAPRHWATVLWIAIKSTSITSLALSNGSTIYGHNLRRVDFDTPNLILTSSVFSSCAALRYMYFAGIFGSSGHGILFSGVMLEAVTLANAAATGYTSCFVNSRIRSISLTVSTTRLLTCQTLTTGNSALRHFSINSVWGTFSGAFGSCPCLKELDFSACPVNGITDFTSNTNMYSLQKLLFPSYIDTDGIRKPKAFATGVTNMGAIDITNSGLDREALVDMFYSLPVNATAVNCKITGSVGAADLTADDIAIAANKNWTVIR